MALFAVRGAAPTNGPDRNLVASSSDDDFLATAWTFLEAIGVEDIVDARQPGSAVHLVSDDAPVMLHESGRLRRRDLNDFADEARYEWLTKIVFVRGEITGGAREKAVANGIGCFRIGSSGKPMPTNWDASGFFDDHSDDESLNEGPQAIPDVL